MMTLTGSTKGMGKRTVNQKMKLDLTRIGCHCRIYTAIVELHYLDYCPERGIL